LAAVFFSLPADLVVLVPAAVFPLDFDLLSATFLVSFLPFASFLPLASFAVDFEADFGPFLAAAALVSFLVVFFGALSFFLPSEAAFFPAFSAFFSAAFF
jgi:hypothetical protein